MSWHYSQALVEAYSEANCSDGALFAPLKSSDTPAAYCWHDKTTESLSLFQYGMMSARSTANLGEDLLTWFRAASRAKTSVSPAPCGGGMGCAEPSPAYGGKCLGLLQRFAHPMFSVKTRPFSASMGSPISCQNWPASGMIVDGSLSALILSDLITNVDGSGSMLPTPTARDWKDTLGMNPIRKDGKDRLDRLPMLLFSLVRSAGISLTRDAGAMGAQTVRLKDLAQISIMGPEYCPELPEWVMGWPIGWSELRPLETGRFQQWQRSHGDYL